jgi:hypothetical protein
MKPTRLYIEPEADAELEEAAERYESTVAGLGLDFLAEMRKRTRDVLEYPERFPAFGKIEGVHGACRRTLSPPGRLHALWRHRARARLHASPTTTGILGAPGSVASQRTMLRHVFKADLDTCPRTHAPAR